MHDVWCLPRCDGAFCAYFYRNINNFDCMISTYSNNLRNMYDFWMSPSVWRSILCIHLTKYQQLRYHEIRKISLCFWRRPPPWAWRSIFVTRLLKYQQFRIHDFKTITIPRENQWIMITPLVWRNIFVIRPPKYQQFRIHDFRIIKIPKEHTWNLIIPSMSRSFLSYF